MLKLLLAALFVAFALSCADRERPLSPPSAKIAQGGLLGSMGSFEVQEGESEAESEEGAQEEPDDQEDEPEAAASVRIPDRNLRQHILWALGRQEGPIAQEDLLSITRLRLDPRPINAKQKEVVDLTGLEYCTNLDTLNLAGNSVEDITPLSKLTKLRLLNLSSNEVEDISPLGYLEELRWLSLWGNEVSDIGHLAALKELTYLSLSGNNIEDVTPLAELDKLEYLRLNENPIEDISPLNGLDNLELSIIDTPAEKGDWKAQVPDLVESENVTVHTEYEGADIQAIAAAGTGSSTSGSCPDASSTTLTSGQNIPPILMSQAQGGVPP